MGILSERLGTRLGDHRIEVRADNHVMRGLIYKLYLDGEELANAQNFLKIPTKRRLEAHVDVDGSKRHIVVSIEQHMLSCDFSMTIDGVDAPLLVEE